MKVTEVKETNCRVESSPEPGNVYHADIILPDGHWETWEDGEVHLRHFLAVGQWKDRHTISPEQQ